MKIWVARRINQPRNIFKNFGICKLKQIKIEVKYSVGFVVVNLQYLKDFFFVSVNLKIKCNQIRISRKSTKCIQAPPRALWIQQATNQTYIQKNLRTTNLQWNFKLDPKRSIAKTV